MLTCPFLPNDEKRPPFFCFDWPLMLASLVFRDIVEMAVAVEDESKDLLGGGRGGAKPLLT